MNRSALLPLVAVLALAACETVEGIKRDAAVLWQKVQPAHNMAAQTDASLVDPIAADCPAVTIMPELKHLAEFTDPADPGELNKISEMTIVGVQNTCRPRDNGMTMQIDLIFSGKIGAKGRANKSDKPNFSYPYFIAVTDKAGTVLSKEVFAANVAYAPDQTESKQIESITQTLPVKSKNDLAGYRVMVGFQLDDAQLAYNRKQQEQPKP